MKHMALGFLTLLDPIRHRTVRRSIFALVTALMLQLTSKKMRRVVLAHSMTSFVFNVSIFVLVVAIIAQKWLGGS